MKITYLLLLNAKPQGKPYKIRDRDSMYLRVSVSGSKVGNSITGWMARIAAIPLGDSLICR